MSNNNANNYIPTRLTTSATSNLYHQHYSPNDTPRTRAMKVWNATSNAAQQQHNFNNNNNQQNTNTRSSPPYPLAMSSSQPATATTTTTTSSNLSSSSVSSTIPITPMNTPVTPKRPNNNNNNNNNNLDPSHTFITNNPSSRLSDAVEPLSLEASITSSSDPYHQINDNNNNNNHPLNSFVTPMLTDFYQITMAYAYWKGGRHNDNAVFELFFRKSPFNGEFTIFAGLSEAIKFVQSYRFTPEQVAFLKKKLPPTVEDEFFEYLLTLDCSQVTIHAMAEGTVVFPRTPLMKIEGPLCICQLLETTLLNLTNFPSLICTNAARMRMAAGEDKVLLEFGLRRAQGPDGAMSASRYSYVGGFDATSNVEAAQLFGIDVRGTHAHAFVSAFEGPENLKTRVLGSCEDFWSLVMEKRTRLRYLSSNIGELAAFVAYAQAFPNAFLALVDTYDTLKSGVPNFIAVALALTEVGFKPLGIRLDSGDLAYLSTQSRELFLDAAKEFNVDLSHLQILASNDINESVLNALDDQGHSIDAFGIGTNLVTCQAQPALGMVYKLVEINGRPTIKLSQDLSKVTIPGSKKVYRLIGSEGVAICDVMVSSLEPPPVVGKRLLCRHPYIERKRANVTPSYVISLLEPVWIKGVAAPMPTLPEIRQFVKDQLQLIRPDHKRFLNPTEYKVSITNELFNFMHEMWLSVVAVPDLS
jgi:nicotinate phosphoribosyltransferase